VKPLWLIGDDIERSLSPAMQNAALAEIGEDAAYALKQCSAAELHAVLDDAERECRGVNVTAPHKVEVARRYADVLDDDARAAGSVNTVIFDGGRAVRALNTDVPGLLFAWKRSALHIEDRTIAVVGAGGAARSVIVAAQQAGARGVVVHARRESAAAGLLVLAAELGLDAVTADRPCGARVAVLASSSLDDPAGTIDKALAGPGAVHDLRYGDGARATRNAALKAGHLFVDGTLMLLAQAQVALAAFLGKAVPEPAATAMRKALTRR
jgi:shikimate dehydrogenase